MIYTVSLPKKNLLINLKFFWKNYIQNHNFENGYLENSNKMQHFIVLINAIHSVVPDIKDLKF